MEKFGIQLGAFSGQIHVGRINKAGTEFLEKESLTNPAVWTVAEYVLKHMGGDMWIANAGRRLNIVVTEDNFGPASEGGADAGPKG